MKNDKNLNTMKTYTIEVFDIDYSGNDFCGEISGEEAVKIYNSMPEILTISFTLTDEEITDWNARVALGESDDWLIDDIVSDYADEIGILCPSSFSYGFID